MCRCYLNVARGISCRVAVMTSNGSSGPIEPECEWLSEDKRLLWYFGSATADSGLNLFHATELRLSLHHWKLCNAVLLWNTVVEKRLLLGRCCLWNCFSSSLLDCVCPPTPHRHPVPYDSTRFLSFGNIFYIGLAVKEPLMHQGTTARKKNILTQGSTGKIWRAWPSALTTPSQSHHTFPFRLYIVCRLPKGVGESGDKTLSTLPDLIYQASKPFLYLKVCAWSFTTRLKQLLYKRSV